MFFALHVVKSNLVVKEVRISAIEIPQCSPSYTRTYLTSPLKARPSEALRHLKASVLPKVLPSWSVKEMAV
jgi:hypothetical protein